MKKKYIIIVAVLFFSVSSIGQKPISRVAIRDFALQCSYHYRYGSDFFKASVTQILMRGGYSFPDVAVVMENLETDVKGREALLKGLYNQFGSSDNVYLFNQLYSIGIKANYAKEIIEYIAIKFGAKETSKPNSVVVSDSTSYFQGTKRFSDGVAWDYVFTITGKLFTLKLFPNKNNDLYKDKSKPKSVITGQIKEGKMISKSGQFKYNNGVLSELNNEDGWNEYRIVSK